jgi:protein gp37
VSQQSAIGWTDLTWNPVHGCSIVSTECRNCYAATLSLRYGQTEKPWTPANAAENVTLKGHKLREPLSNGKDWRGLGAAAAAAGKTDGKLVFVNSMSDLFHEQVPFDFIAEVLNVMAEAERHTFQVLTKRPERIFDFFDYEQAGEGWYAFPDNVWVGVSVGNRQFLRRVDMLRDVPAAVKFISAEPLLGPLLNERGYPERPGRAWRWEDGHIGPSLSLDHIDWLIVGGESGPGYRPMDPYWVEELRDEARHSRCWVCDGSGRVHYGAGTVYDHFRPCHRCHGSGRGTAFFFKQDCGARAGQRGRFADEHEWPQEFPLVAPALEAVPA